jgi:hypothetical protein
MSNVAQRSGNLSSGTCHADDAISISLRRLNIDVEKAGKKHKVLATIDTPSDSSLSVAQLVVLSACIMDVLPLYKLFEMQCLIYGRVFWYQLSTLLGYSEPQRYIQTGYLSHGGNGRQPTPCEMKRIVTQCVRVEVQSLQIAAKYETAWNKFCAKCDARKQVCSMSNVILNHP